MRLGSVTLASLTLLVAGSASADESKVVGVWIDGTIDVAGAVPKGWSVADASQFEASMRTEGQQNSAGKALHGKDRGAVFARARKVAAAAHDQAVVLLSVERRSKSRVVSVVVLDPSRDGPIAEVTLKLPLAPSAADTKKLAAALEGPLASIVPAATAAPAVTTPVAGPAPAPSTVDAPLAPPAPSVVGADATPPGEEAPTRGDATRSIAEISTGFALGSRHFSYNDPRGTNLRPYDVDGAPMLSVGVALNPFAGTVLRDVGFFGDYASAIGLGSATRNSTRISTAWSSFHVGGRVRARVGNRARPVMIGASGSYGLELFRFTDTTTIDSELPSVSYGFVRGMLDARVPVGPVAFSLALGYLHVVANGEVGLRVRGTRNDGVEATVGASLPFAKVLEARLSGTYTRFFYSFDPVPGDAYVAGGALDQYLTGQLALAWLY